MMETTRPQRESAGGGPSVLGSIFDTQPGRETAMVTHGPYAEALPVANLTIGQIRQRFGDRLDLDPNSQATVDGEEANDLTVVRAGQVVIFIRRAGEKGRRGQKWGVRNAECGIPAKAGRSHSVHSVHSVHKATPAVADKLRRGVVIQGGVFAKASRTFREDGP